MSDGIGPGRIRLCLTTGAKPERLCGSEKWPTRPAKWDKCPIKRQYRSVLAPRGVQGRKEEEGEKKSVRSVLKTVRNCMDVCSRTLIWMWQPPPDAYALEGFHLATDGDGRLSLKSPFHRRRPGKRRERSERRA